MNKKIFTTLLAVAMLASSTAAFAAEDTTTENTPVLISEAEVVSAAYTMTEAEVKDGAVNGIDVKDCFILNENGEAVELKDGDTVKVFAAEGKSTVVVVTETEGVAVDVDTYKTSDTFGVVINSVEELALNIDENSDIVDLNGEKVAHTELDGKDLVVFYNMATMSIPAQTNPLKVVVLPAQKVEAREDEAVEEIKFESAYTSTEAEIGEGSFEIIKNTNSIVLNMNGEIIEPVTGKAMIYQKKVSEDDSEIYIMQDEEAVMAVNVDVFTDNGEMLVNAANTLALIIGEETEVVNLDGEAVEELSGKSLAVFYDISTRSIPAQTTPKKVVVLENAASEEVVVDYTKVTSLTAGDKEIGAISFDSAKNTFMVPVRAISEALGYDVAWEGETKTVTIASGEEKAQMVIGENAYVGSEEVALEAAPELREDRTYAPVSFFEKVLGAVISVVDSVLSINK